MTSAEGVAPMMAARVVRTDRAGGRPGDRSDGHLGRDGGGAGRRLRDRLGRRSRDDGPRRRAGGFHAGGVTRGGGRGSRPRRRLHPDPHDRAARRGRPVRDDATRSSPRSGASWARCPGRWSPTPRRRISRGTCPATRWGGASDPGPSTPRRRSSTGSCGCSRRRRRPIPAPSRALETWIEGLGASVVRMPADRHDRLVAFVSHLPQVASTALMSLAATEEADEPEILLLAAGGFRDLTRLAASDAGSVVLDPAREPRADRRGDRPLRRSPPEPAGGRPREPRRRGAIDVRAGEGGSSPPRDQATGEGRAWPCSRSRCPTGPALWPS